MKTVEFDYVDLKGKESHRVLLVTSSPSNKYSGIDITEMDDEDAGSFIREYEDLWLDFQNQVEFLKETYDVKHNFRQFLENSMSNVVFEEI